MKYRLDGVEVTSLLCVDRACGVMGSIPASTSPVVDQIDNLTSDLQLEDEMTDSSKTDTLNSSSSSTTASSIDKIKVRANAPLISPPVHQSAVLTVLRKPNPPAPPPRLTPVKFEDTHRLDNTPNPVKNNVPLIRNGGLPGGPTKVPNGDRCAIHNINVDKFTAQPLTHRPQKDRCSQTTTRERVRFSENVLYHGYCPDCDIRSEIRNREVHLTGESIHLGGKISHQCPPLPSPTLPSFPVENGGLGISSSSSQPPQKSGMLPPPTAPKPQKTILRKSTTTTV
uniref:Proline rich 16 n=1 Tax=Leptobrachium leishanense TaxID=445787 RepID=A0A8C5PCP8_9ANUR